MHIAPFIFEVKNKNVVPTALIGYLRYSISRRNKDKIRVSICLGADPDYIMEIDRHETHELDYERMFATWLSMYGHDEDYFGKEIDLGSMTNDRFSEFLTQNGAKLRFW